MRRYATVSLGVVLAFAGCAPSDGDATDGDGSSGGKADDPAGARPFGDDLVTVWEAQVGSAGDAVLETVVRLPDGSLLATSSAPSWIRKFRPSGRIDKRFGEPWPGDPLRRTGLLDVPAKALWLTGSDHFLAATGYDFESVFLDVRAFMTADGAPDTSFAAAGMLDLPYSSDQDGEQTVALEYDASADRLLALVVREWQMIPGSSGSLPERVGPRTVELLDIETLTGGVTSRGQHALPAWTGRRFPDGDQAAVRGVFPQPDGSVVVLASETIDGQTPVRPNNIGTRWSAIRLAAGASPASQTLLEGEFEPDVAGVARLDDGGVHLYLSGAFDGFSTAWDDTKLMRVTIAPRAASFTAVALGAGLDLGGGVFDPGCHAAAASTSQLVYAQGDLDGLPIQFTAYSTSGQVAMFSSDLPGRCVDTLRLTAQGTAFVGSWDTSAPSWRALISKLAPAP
jgi:hypothetical protein